MAPRIDDRWLWLGLGVFTFIAIKGVAHGLRTIVHLTEVHTKPPQPSNPLPARGKEDAIKTASLEILATCDNVEIRKAATKILCERFFAHGPSRTRLLRELSSPNATVQRRARLAFNLLCDYGVVQEVVLPPTPRTLRAERRPDPNATLTWLDGRTNRPRNHEGSSAEERDLRRRRREAMVINEGDRPVSQEDVWMRDGTGRMSSEETRDPRELYADLRRLADALASADQTAEGLRVRLEHLGFDTE
ncbi:uncharacterized protein BDR25DRAFT_305217 [Lindgomyces ingoldianus]|uniref:Uncharacterized protein n=1 Tax=Lindgomyces ingoldianus TaxID=673940 RepID=A0ACB6QMW0_9PLEO|nr:uncharacterized protein BDR25DRAFT_305217 [Lindgomyces ingoldianus]KAF2468236.1 hypothetical protein BDR25DRAFT_305217 [Lindgomyces ingoldianus]